MYFALIVSLPQTCTIPCDFVCQCFLGSALSEKWLRFYDAYETSHTSYRYTEIKTLNFKISTWFNLDSVPFIISWIEEPTIS